MVLANSTKLCYTYDNLSRVTARTVKKLSDNSVVSTETFNYDAAGNVTSAPDSSFQYDTNNRLISFNGNTVSYDLDGNILSNGSLTCTYDSSNKLITAGGHTYTYNAEDVRIRNLCNTEDTTYTYDTNCKLSKLLTKTTDGVVTKYVYGNGLIGEETNSTFRTYHFDFRGSTVAITDSNGTITDTFAYDTYGKLLSRTGTSKVIFGYNGRDGVVTEDNGLIYMRARYYSPDMRRFINADIIAGSISNAVTLNRFAYANGNPVSNIDPFGLRAERLISQNMVKDDGGLTDRQIAIKNAVGIGERAIVEKGTISINMDQESQLISEIKTEIGMQYMCDLIAVSACNKYEQKVGEEFRLSDLCVSYEIEEHIVAYEWAVKKRSLPNLLALGYIAKNALDAFSANWSFEDALSEINRTKVYKATKSIDMCEKDIVKSNSPYSQSVLFNYKDGIRGCYIGTESDPWAEERQSK